MLWAWKRPEDLRFLVPGDGEVGVLAGTLWLRGQEAEMDPRRLPLQVREGTRVIAVIRIEVDRRQAPVLDSAQLDRAEIEIRKVAKHPSFQGLQIDYDARVSERSFYAKLLERLR
ncbi:MAG: hypothetical protein GY953_26565, partial [bacterium]|nr:hypothetical protein [bacterium]